MANKMSFFVVGKIIKYQACYKMDWEMHEVQ